MPASELSKGGQVDRGNREKPRRGVQDPLGGLRSSEVTPERYAVVRWLKAEVSWGRADVVDDVDELGPVLDDAFMALEAAGDDLNNRYIGGKREMLVLEHAGARLWLVDQQERGWIDLGVELWATPCWVESLRLPALGGMSSDRLSDRYHFHPSTTPAKDHIAYALGFVDGYKGTVETEDSSRDYVYGYADGREALEANRLPPWVTL